MSKWLDPKSPFAQWLSPFMKGGELTENEWAMLAKKVRNIAGMAFLAFAATFTALAWLLTGSDWTLYWKYNLARFLDICFLGDSSLWGFTTKSGNLLTASELVAQYHDKYHGTFWFRTPIIFVLSLLVFGGVIYLIQKAYVARGKSVGDEHIRGANIVENEVLEAAVANLWVEYKERHAKEVAEAEKKGAPPPPPLEELQPKFTFAGVTLPPGGMQQNILATGGMGTGKSTAIFDLADQVANYGLTMICYDRTGEFVQYYYRPDRDYLFCPFDLRDVRWNLFDELETDLDFGTMVNGWIPPAKKQTDGEIFQSAARTQLEAMLRKLKKEGETDPARATPETLWECITSDPKVLGIWLADTPAADLYGPDKSKNGGAGAHATLKEKLKVLQYVRSGKGSFSLKKFIREGGDHRLFILSHPMFAEVVQPLTAVAMNIILAESVCGKQDPKRLRRVIFMDEKKSLGKVDKLGMAVTEGRKYGNCLVVGVQGIHQLDIYEEIDAKDFRANLSTQLIMRVADEDTSERYSKLIGEAEVKQWNENKSWGADARDGGGGSESRTNRRAVMASEINYMADRTGFVKLPGNLPLTKVSFPYKGRDSIAPDFMPRDLNYKHVEAERAADAEARRHGKRAKEETIAIPTVASETARTAVVEEVDGQELFDTVVGIFQEAAAKQETGSAPSPEVVESAPAEVEVVVEAPGEQAEAKPDTPASDDSVTSAEAALQAALASIR